MCSQDLTMGGMVLLPKGGEAVVVWNTIRIASRLLGFFGVVPFFFLLSRLRVGQPRNAVGFAVDHDRIFCPFRLFLSACCLCLVLLHIRRITMCCGEQGRLNKNTREGQHMKRFAVQGEGFIPDSPRRQLKPKWFYICRSETDNNNRKKIITKTCRFDSYCSLPLSHLQSVILVTFLLSVLIDSVL